MMKESIPIHVEGAHVWTADPYELQRSGLLASFSAILSLNEHARMGRFRFERDRLSYLAAHGLARLVLSACLPAVPPQDWQFRSTPCGRPEIAAPVVQPVLRFNLSHTQRLVACLVVPSIDCGIDVETLDRRVDLDRLVPSTLSPPERERFSALPPRARPDLFFRYWTLKEAYAKGRGCGLALPLDTCTFTFRTDDRRPILASARQDDTGDWQFAQWLPTSHHVLAVALRRGSGVDYRIVRHDGPPRIA